MELCCSQESIKSVQFNFYRRSTKYTVQSVFFIEYKVQVQSTLYFSKQYKSTVQSTKVLSTIAIFKNILVERQFFGFGENFQIFLVMSASEIHN